MEIEYLDFTPDNMYLMYKEKDNTDPATAINFIDLKNLVKINALFIEQDVEWTTDGIKVSGNSKEIYNYYGDDN